MCFSFPLPLLPISSARLCILSFLRPSLLRSPLRIWPLRTPTKPNGTWTSWRASSSRASSSWTASARQRISFASNSSLRARTSGASLAFVVFRAWVNRPRVCGISRVAFRPLLVSCLSLIFLLYFLPFYSVLLRPCAFLPTELYLLILHLSSVVFLTLCFDLT
jgi:hypothetical protein